MHVGLPYEDYDIETLNNKTILVNRNHNYSQKFPLYQVDMEDFLYLRKQIVTIQYEVDCTI